MSLLIKNLRPGLTERGKIKIGEKGQMVRSASGTSFQPPKKLDHFRVTTLERGPDDNYLIDREVHKLYGEKPRVLPVRLLYNDADLNFQSRYCCYQGKKLWCSGDGEVALRMTADGTYSQVNCPCERLEPGYQPAAQRCKINGTLSVMIDGVSRVGGVWKLRTTSWNTVSGIMSSIALIQSLTGGVLAGLPLQLTLNPKTAVVPDTGKSTQVWVVGLEFDGSMDQLQQIGYERAKNNALFAVKMEQIECTVRKLIGSDSQPLASDIAESAEIVEEFYPEQLVVDVEPEPQHIPAPLAEMVEAEASKAQSTEQQPVTPTEPEPQKRRRTNKFTTDPELFGGKEQIVTCGVNPDQLVQIRKLAQANAQNRESIKSFMKAVGYEELSFLRAEEAQQLLGLLSEVQPEEPEPAPPAAGPDDLVSCPLRHGDSMSKSGYCLTDCPDRKRDGFCPILGEEPSEGQPMF